MQHRVARAGLLFATLLLVACAGLNPVAAAKTPEQRYAAVKLTYDALLTPAADFVADTTIPATARRAVQQAAAASGTIYKSLNQAFVDYVAAKAQLAGGATTSDKLTIASSNLETWVTQLEHATGELATLTSKRGSP